MKRLLIACGLVGVAVAGAARAQVNFEDQPISNLQNGISPRVAAVRRQQDDKATAIARLNKAANERAIAVRGRLAEHDCTGARNLAAQDRDPTLSTEVETLCAPAVMTNAPGPPAPPP